MTLYTDGDIRLWAESYNADAFMNSAAYFSYCFNKQRSVRIGGSLINGANVPELKVEYLLIGGPTNSSEDVLLVAGK